MTLPEFKVGEVFFFATKGKIEKHTITGSFIQAGEVHYVFTPLGNIASATVNEMFKTFEEAKESLLDSARAELGRVESIIELCVLQYPSERPTEAELQADDQRLAEEAMDQAEKMVESMDQEDVDKAVAEVESIQRADEAKEDASNEKK